MGDTRLLNYVECNPTVKLKKGEFYNLVDIDSITVGVKYSDNKGLVEYTGQSGSKFSKGDTIMARITPCLENGKIAMYNGDVDSIGSTELFVFRAIPNVSNKDFVYYFMKQNSVRNYAANSMTGASGRQRADIKFVKKLKCSFPILETQNKIADILSTYDELIENNNKRIQLLEQMAENLYKEWFVRFRFPGYETAKFEDGIPKGWGIKKIGDIARVKSGYAFKSEWWTDEGVPVVKIKDIQNNTIDFSDLSRVTEENTANAKQFFVVEGDLLIAMTGATIGKLALVPNSDERLVVNQRVGKFFCGDTPINSVAFLYYTLQQNWVQELIAMIAGSNAAQPNISPFDIEKIKVLYNEEIVENFNNIVSKYIEQILLLIRKNQNLIKQRDLLLPRLMSGKLEV